MITAMFSTPSNDRERRLILGDVIEHTVRTKFGAATVGRLVCVGAVLITVGCGASATVSSTAPGHGSVESTSGAEDRDQLIMLQNQLREARQKLEDQYNSNPDIRQGCFAPPFLVIAPADLTGYDVGPLEIFGMDRSGSLGVGSLEDYDLGPMGASVTVRLVDRGNPTRWVSFRQESACNGVSAGPPQNATNISPTVPVEVPSLDPNRSLPRLSKWTEADGSSTVLLDWCSDCFASPATGYQIAGHNVGEEALVSMAASMQPVCCGPGPPTTTVAATVASIGSAVSATWSSGAATVTINEAKWAQDTTGMSEHGTVLVLDLTYQVTSGTVPYNPMLDWTARTVSGASINALASPDDPAVDPDLVLHLEPGQEFHRRINLGLPQEPTTVHLSEGLKLLASWSIPT